MLEIKVNGQVYQVKITVTKYGAILEIKKDGKRWYLNTIDLYAIKGSLNDYITDEIQVQEQALKG